MNNEEKQLLLRDLCGRLPYGVKMKYKDDSGYEVLCQIDTFYKDIDGFHCLLRTAGTYGGFQDLNELKPYLRPMSSMTQEERDEIEEMSHGWFYVNEDGEIFPVGQLTDSGEFEDAILPTLEWLNKKMFDYRGLIPMGLALEAPDGMYKFE